jgi:hypothetical protein
MPPSKPPDRLNSRRGNPFSAECLADDFGSDSQLAHDGIRALYEAISATDDAKALMLFRQWKVFLREACGIDVNNSVDKIKKLADIYGVPVTGTLRAAELLYAVHSYYAIFTKLLAAKTVAFRHRVVSPFWRMPKALSSAKLHQTIEELESGNLLRCLNISNFLDGDLFAWYVAAWSKPIERFVRDMVARLDSYDAGTLSEDRDGSRDLVKLLYQQLFPRNLRRDLGEFYTPDWLAEHVLAESGYAGDPDKRLLDPACGSGTFLVMAINRVRRWYDKNRAQCQFDEVELCRRILANVIGFDLNPLAVMAARTNYLVAIRDLIGRVEKVEIPIYLCDSIVTMPEYAELTKGKVDYIVGNPPWINWESLPTDYRQSTMNLWDKYRLRDRATPGARLGNVKRELSSLFTYVCIDNYLDNGGTLGFVITQSVFKTGANEGFRRFSCARDVHFQIQSVSDLSHFRPFDNAINRTAVVVASKGGRTKYPIPYRLWIPGPLAPASLAALISDNPREYRIVECLAAPVEPSVRESAWLTAPETVFPILRTFIGDRDSAIMNRTYAGSCTWLNGVYWVEQVEAANGSIVVRNLHDIGKKKVKAVTLPVEHACLFPLLRGRDVHAWRASPSAEILLPHRANSFSDPVSLAELERTMPLTHHYFHTFAAELRSRSGYKQFHRQRPEFYVVGNVGNHTIAPYKVVFKELTDVFQCAVVGPARSGILRTPRPIVPDHKLLFLTCSRRDEAFFLAGVLNSIPARVALYGASAGVQTQSYYPTDVSRLRIPAYCGHKEIHGRIVRISIQCHKLAARSADSERIREEEARLAQAVAAMWKISPSELAILKRYYCELLNYRARSGPAVEGPVEN